MPARRTHGRPVPEGLAEAQARRTRVGGAGVLSRGPRATPTRAAPARLADPQGSQTRSHLPPPALLLHKEAPACMAFCVSPEDLCAPSRG